MAIILPNLNHPECKEFAVCGELVTTDKGLTKWMMGTPLMVAPHQIGSEPGFLVLILGGSSDNHVHVEINRAENFRNRKPPNPTCTIKDIDAALSRISDHEVKARIWGDFWIPLSELPLFISATMFQVVQGNVTLKQTGGTLSVQGAPISKISWSSLEKENMVDICLGATKRLKITDTYLVEALNEIEPAFSAFVLKGKTNVGLIQRD